MKISVSAERVASLHETNVLCSLKNILTTQSWSVSAVGVNLRRYLCNLIKCHNHMYFYLQVI